VAQPKGHAQFRPAYSGKAGFDYIATIGVCRIAVIVGNVVTVIRLLVAGCSWMVAEEVPALSRFLSTRKQPSFAYVPCAQKVTAACHALPACLSRAREVQCVMRDA